MELEIDTFNKDSSLIEIQDYMLAKAKERGFTQETANETLLVMIEEVGELAKALRKQIGVGIDHERLANYGNLKHEMADVFICLLILANKCEVNLFEAFCEKEAINSKRIWKSKITKPAEEQKQVCD